MDAFCISGHYHPCCLQEQLTRRRLQPLLRSIGVENGVDCVDTRTSMAKGLCEQGEEMEEAEEEAEDLFANKSKQLNHREDSSSFVALLKTCAQQKDLAKGRKLHNVVVEKGFLLTDPFIGSTVINMYAKCGSVTEAQEVFDELPFKNVVSWTSLITGYALCGRSEEALHCFERMQHEGFHPDRVTFLSVLKACGSLGAVDKSQQIHAQILNGGLLENDTGLGIALVDVYAKCSLFAKAQEVFDTLGFHDVVSWNALITGYAYYRHGEEALNCFEQMQREGIPPNAVTFASVLKACSILGALDKGQGIHAKVVREGNFLVKDMTVVNSLLDMYAKCGMLTKAQEVFDELPARNVVSWNALIAGHTQSGQGEEALSHFEWMQLEGFSPDAFTFSCTLKACGIIGMADKGQQLHAEIAREDSLDKNFVVANALLDMYAKCGLLAEAQDIFDNLPNQDVVSWSALIVGYAKHGHSQEALNCFDRMLLKGYFPNAVTLLGVLKACGSIGAAYKGQEVHTEIVRDELLEKDIMVGTALVDMYARCGMLAEAQHVFDELPCWDVISWNALIAGYSQHADGEEALSCFEQMQFMGFLPDLVTFVCVLKACGSIGAACKAQELHNELVRDEFLETDLVVGNSLIDMYASCGMLAEAQKVFDNLPISDIVSWNALLAGYAQLGQDEVVFELYNKMAVQVKEPDLITFTIVLNTYSHRGLLDKGQLFFETMSTSYGILPTVEHHACMVDLFGRAGRAEEVVTVIKESPFAPDVMVWSTLLGACQKLGDMKLGRWVCEHTAQFNGRDSAIYVCMSNFYAAGDRLESVHQIEASMEEAMMLLVD